MTTEQIKEIQRTIGTKDDGRWGPKSNAACKSYLGKMMPSPNPFPRSGETQLRLFYGMACDEDQIINFPAPVEMYYEGRRVRTIRCHTKIQDPLGRALTAAYETSPHVIKIYDGCFNCRPVSGSGTWSLHARAAAVDIWAAKNGNKMHWPNKALMPLIVMEAFSREGFLSGGAFWNRDAMHMQATQ